MPSIVTNWRGSGISVPSPLDILNPLLRERQNSIHAVPTLRATSTILLSSWFKVHNTIFDRATTSYILGNTKPKVTYSDQYSTQYATPGDHYPDKGDWLRIQYSDTAVMGMHRLITKLITEPAASTLALNTTISYELEFIPDTAAYDVAIANVLDDFVEDDIESGENPHDYINFYHYGTWKIVPTLHFKRDIPAVSLTPDHGLREEGHYSLPAIHTRSFHELDFYEYSHTEDLISKTKAMLRRFTTSSEEMLELITSLWVDPTTSQYTQTVNGCSATYRVGALTRQFLLTPYETYTLNEGVTRTPRALFRTEYTLAQAIWDSHFTDAQSYNLVIGHTQEELSEDLSVYQLFNHHYCLKPTWISEYGFSNRFFRACAAGKLKERDIEQIVLPEAREDEEDEYLDLMEEVSTPPMLSRYVVKNKLIMLISALHRPFCVVVAPSEALLSLKDNGQVQGGTTPAVTLLAYSAPYTLCRQIIDPRNNAPTVSSHLMTEDQEGPHVIRIPEQPSSLVLGTSLNQDRTIHYQPEHSYFPARYNSNLLAYTRYIQTFMEASPPNLRGQSQNIGRREERVLNYSADVLNSIPLRNPLNNKLISDTKYGVELEVSTDVPCSQMVAVTSEPFFICKSDSSISGSKRNNYEIVTTPAPMREQKRYWYQMFKTFNSNQFDHTLRTNNGMHVHTSLRAFSSEAHRNNFVWFWCAYPNRPFFQKLCERDAASFNSYAGPIPRLHENNMVHDYTRAFSLICSNSNYQRGIVAYKLHSTGNATLEIRAFKGVANIGSVYKNLEAVDASIEFTRQSNFQSNSIENFLKWVKETPKSKYRTLKQFLELINPEVELKFARLTQLLKNTKQFLVTHSHGIQAPSSAISSMQDTLNHLNRLSNITFTYEAQSQLIIPDNLDHTLLDTEAEGIINTHRYSGDALCA